VDLDGVEVRAGRELARRPRVQGELPRGGPRDRERDAGQPTVRV